MASRAHDRNTKFKMLKASLELRGWSFRYHDLRGRLHRTSPSHTREFFWSVFHPHDCMRYSPFSTLQYAVKWAQASSTNYD